jgi:hypothetical protein
MNKVTKIIAIALITIVALYLSYFVFNIFRYAHVPSWITYKNYMWVFKDSTKSDIDTNFCYSYVRKRDIYNNFHYKKIYNIILWDLKDLKYSTLDDISINQGANLNDIKFASGEVLNKESDLEINIKSGNKFTNKMNVQLDKISKIERIIETERYKGFYGSINKMTFNNEKNEAQMLFNYVKGSTPSIFLVFKGHGGFYAIIINSEQPVDENIINILDLN